MDILTATALDVARTQIGQREDPDTPNWSAVIATYLASVGWAQPAPWCSAFVHWCFRVAAGKTGLVNPVPKTLSSRQIWALAEPITRDSNPQSGYIYVLRHTETTGHVGIVESVLDGFVTEEISGNTFADHGGREGNCVARNKGQPEVTHGGTLLGYLDFSRAAQQPNVVA